MLYNLIIKQTRPDNILQSALRAFRTTNINPSLFNNNSDSDSNDSGKLISIENSIAQVHGLAQVRSGEMVEFPSSGLRGMVLSLEMDKVSVIILNPDSELKEGDIVKRMGSLVDVPVGACMLGRVVDALGNTTDEQSPILSS